jgi:hyperosmotically inducible protein
MKTEPIYALAIVAAMAVPVLPLATTAYDAFQAQKPPTADKQSQSKADIALTQQIRRAVVKDKSLSINAHNCKIITQQGSVTLRGAVNSESEVTAVGAIATQFAGAGKVTNLLTVKVKRQ